MIDRTDQRIGRFFDDGPTGGTSDGLARALARSRTVAQRRGWRSGRLGVGTVRVSLRLAVALALLVIVTVSLAVVGSRLIDTPAPPESIMLSVNEVLTRFDPLDPAASEVVVGDLADHIEYPSYSPDGSKVAFWSAATFNSPVDLVVADADLTDRHILLVARTYRSPSPITWSPDGKRLAVEGNDSDGTSQVHVVGADGSGWHALAPDLDVRSAAWSPDSSWVAMRGTDHHETFVGIYLVHPDGSDLHSLIRSQGVDWSRHKLSAFSWSPDGREMAFTWYGDTTFQDGMSFASMSAIVAVIDVGTGEIRALTDHATDIAPVWSPDGDRIAFIRVGLGAAMTIRPDGTDMQQIATGGIVSDMVWSPDGSRLALVVGDDDRLVIAPMDGSPVRDTGITGVVTRPTWTSLP